MDSAYFCYPALAVVSSYGEGGSRSAVLLPRGINPLCEVLAAGVGLFLAELVLSYSHWLASGGCESVLFGSLGSADRELTVPTLCGLAWTPKPTKVSDVVVGPLLTPARGMLPC